MTRRPSRLASRIAILGAMVLRACGPAPASAPVAAPDPHAAECAAAKAAAQTEVTRCQGLCPDGGRCCPIYLCSTVSLDKWREMHSGCSDSWAPLWPESTTGVTSTTCEQLYHTRQPADDEGGAT